MRWPTPPTGPDGAAITNIAPGPATTPATASDFHDQRSTTAVLADGGDRPGSEQSIRQASSQRQHTFATLGSPAPARPGAPNDRARPSTAAAPFDVFTELTSRNAWIPATTCYESPNPESPNP